MSVLPVLLKQRNHENSLKKKERHESVGDVALKGMPDNLNNMKWIIEKHLFDYTAALSDAIRAFGDQAFVVNFDPNPNEAIAAAQRKFGTDFFQRAIIHGSTRLAVETPLGAQLFGGTSQFSVSTYTPKLGAILLNPSPKACAWRELVEQAQPLGQKIFVRPDVPWKTFSGKVLTRDALPGWYASEGSLRNIPPETSCQISVFQPIEAEWRVLMIDRKAVTCSRYGTAHGENDSSATEVMVLAEQLSSYAETMTVDVCRTNGIYKVVELGNLNTCDWYASDLQKVVPALSAYAAKYFSQV